MGTVGAVSYESPLQTEGEASPSKVIPTFPLALLVLGTKASGRGISSSLAPVQPPVPVVTASPTFTRCEGVWRAGCMQLWGVQQVDLQVLPAWNPYWN